ncbi:MAG: DUF1080 domain-containing protein [Chitinophagaceae bacterium]
MKLLVLFLCLVSPLMSSAQKFTSLYNGKDLSGWKINGTEKWYVENGEIIGESGPDKGFGYLSTEKPYKNFILEMHFLFERGNSGVFFRSNIDGQIIDGWQVDVSEKFTGKIFESYGRGNLCLPSEKVSGMYKPNEWNYLRIYVNDDRVTTWLNGREMCDLQDKQIGAGEGYIALQVHHDGETKVRWKNIRIRELGK